MTSRTEPAVAAAWLFDGVGGAHALSGDRTVVGRQPDSELVVLASSISRQHAELARSGDGWRLRDLGSRNGCHVDGHRTQGRPGLGERASGLPLAIRAPRCSATSAGVRSWGPGPPCAGSAAGGIRYQALAWGSLELAVRHREGDELAGASVLVRVNAVLGLRRSDPP